MASLNVSLEPPSVAFTGEARYLTALWVSGTGYELSKSATTEGMCDVSFFLILTPYVFPC